jgi:hypothetical protein
MKKWLAFDIESAHGDIEIGFSGISVIAATTHLATTAMLWVAPPAEALANNRVCEFLRWLAAMHKEGYDIVTWNGTSFDYRVLAKESGWTRACSDLARASYDPCFQFLCRHGFPVGIAAVADGMNLNGKTEGMNGVLAVDFWLQGIVREVVDYCIQDVRSTLDIVQELEAYNGPVRWRTKSGRIKMENIGHLRPVNECLSIPEPYRPLMRRADFYDWFGKE